MNTASRPKMRKPAAVYILFISLIVVGLGAIFGGGVLILDTSGSILNMSVAIFKDTPFTDYLIPGIILLFVLGMYPLLVAYALLRRPSWKWGDALNPYREQHWSFTHALFTGIILVLWMDFQIMFIGYSHFIQTVYSLLGVLIIILALLPQVKKC